MEFENVKIDWQRLVVDDPFLGPYEQHIYRRVNHSIQTAQRLTQNRMSLSDFASAHEYFGLHFVDGQWIFREWAPNATALYLIGEMTDWRAKEKYALKQNGFSGEWEIHLPAEAMWHKVLYRLRIFWPGGHGDRIPAYARRVIQDPETLIFNAQVWQPSNPYQWQQDPFKREPDPPLIYEAHVGMSQDKEGIGTYREFTEYTLSRIVNAGYNTIQLMAIQEHPYYGSFGYHVSNFFAASSRFGTPEELKHLIDVAHGAGLTVIMDLVHSHAVNNEVEGLSRFDGTLHQYFHRGKRGFHEAWDSRCFDYGKIQVLHFLLSNCRFWLDEYRFDGFRFDGITSMLYHHHGLGEPFTSYKPYFSVTVDEDAVTYLFMANRVIHDVRPDAITIAEDISGMPGLAAPQEHGGIGFDYRLAMGVPDYWIRLTKDIRDQDWHMGGLWYELTNRRRDEKTIGYAESHDQALVGDQALIFRLIDAEMYDHMSIGDANLRVERGMALHKLIRFITMATAGNGYQNFMGNEFGHPEWIDFPREGNRWSYKYARRQWHLMDNPNLKYQYLANFDRDMIAFSKKYDLLSHPGLQLLHEQTEDKVIAFERADLVFVFNFHPSRSHVDYQIHVPLGQYQLILHTDMPEYGGHNRLEPDQLYVSPKKGGDNSAPYPVRLYLPNRTGLVLLPTDCIKRD